MFTLKNSCFYLVICVMVSVLLIPGVFATWDYSYTNPGGPDSFASSLVMFGYTPEEILPDGDDVSVIGENHLTLIHTVLNHSSYGLNATKKPVIHNTLSSSGAILYCDQNVKGGNLKHLMIDGVSESEKLYFVILKVSDIEYHIFTLADADLDKSVGTEIEVYRTYFIKNEKGVWEDTVSYRGYAKVNSKAIDITTWRVA